MLADVAGVHELILLHHPIDWKDDSGSTPLLDACINLENLVKNEKSGPLFAIRHKAYIQVIRLLIQHHAELDVIIHEQSPLISMARIEQWDLFELLLQHGARPITYQNKPISHALPSSLRPRADLLIKFHFTKRRPARLCPCHSGLTVQQCHDSSTAKLKTLRWPAGLVCPCAFTDTPRVHSACCGKRGIQYAVWWQDNRLAHDRMLVHQETIDKVRSLVSPEAQKFISSSTTQGFLERSMSERDMARKVVLPAVEGLLSRKELDPAFGAVIKRFGYNLGPVGHKSPKAEKELNAREWNGYAEEYIRSGVDPRARRDIEIACKVGIHGGPMYRVCESDQCNNREAEEGQYKVCSACKMTVYCSSDCQAHAWKAHKKACGSKGQIQQWIPDTGKVKDEIQKRALQSAAQLDSMAHLMSMMGLSPEQISEMA